MTQTIKQEDGTEIEVFTAEEIEAQKQAAIDEYKANNPDKTEELDALQVELKSKEEELEKLKNKDLNFTNLRKQKEGAEAKIEEIKKEIDQKLEQTKKEVLEGVMKDHYTETLNALAEDEETKKKIEFHYKRLGDIPNTKQGITDKLKDAYLLATKIEANDALNSSVISSGGVGKLNIKGQEKKFTPEEKALAQKLAQAGGMTLKDEDFK